MSSSSTKRKHVYSEQLQSELRVPRGGQEIVRVMGGRGNNLHDAENASGDKFLISMPNKFRRNVWVKRGDYVLVERIAEGDKVKAEIVSVLTKDHIKFYKKRNCWPEKFQENNTCASVRPTYMSSSSDED